MLVTPVPICIDTNVKTKQKKLVSLALKMGISSKLLEGFLLVPGNEFSMRADCKMPRLDPHHIVKSELENETTFRAHLLNKTLLFFFF